MELLPILGLMSGTSMDGIDASIIKTNGCQFERTNITDISPYSSKTDLMLNDFLINPEYFLNDPKFLEQLEILITNDHISCVQKILKITDIKPFYIGFHGQTIYHNPYKRNTVQIGNAQRLADQTNIKVVYNFRKNDIKNGGQGAPIAPVYHKALMQQLNVEQPACFINIGGISNITYWDGINLIGFDSGPGNTLIDTFVKRHYNLKFDNNGNIARLGLPNQQIITEFLNDEFFKLSYPKSLDKFSFNYILDKYNFQTLDKYNSISTLTHLTIEAISLAISELPKKCKTIIVCGGGQHNKYLIDNLKIRLNTNLFTANEIGIPGDLLEAEMIAFLTGRYLRELNFTYPETTGVKVPCSGGDIVTPNYKTF